MRELERESMREHDPEATNVSPLFDEEATVVAQPVVPLDDRAVAEDVGTYVGAGTAPPVYARAWRRRTQWMIALVVGALAVGTIAGIIGLRLYEKRRASTEATPAEQTPVQAEAQQPATDAAKEAEIFAPQVSESEAETATGEEERAGHIEDRAETNGGGETAREKAESGREVIVAELPVKRGKKGEVEAEEERDRVEPVPPPVYDTQGSAPPGSQAERRAAREEQRLRRMRRETREGRRERRGQRVDSVRGIFEGRSESPPR